MSKESKVIAKLEYHPETGALTIRESGPASCSPSTIDDRERFLRHVEGEIRGVEHYGPAVALHWSQYHHLIRELIKLVRQSVKENRGAQSGGPQKEE